MMEITVDSDVRREPVPYDYSAGDERTPDRDIAIARAIERSYERGCRQTVRTSTAPACGMLWLIQDVR